MVEGKEVRWRERIICKNARECVECEKSVLEEKDKNDGECKANDDDDCVCMRG